MELFTELTVREHLVVARRVKEGRQRFLGFFLDLSGFGERPGPGEDEAVAEILALLGLESVADRPALAVPLGTGRLVEVARALASEPSVMLLDEPSSGLDVHETEQLGDALRRVRAERGTAFVLVEHNVEFVLDLSDRVTVLDFGKLLTEGTPDEIRNSPEVQAAYFGAPLATDDRHGGARVNESAPLLEVTDLEVAYGEARALFGVSFDVPRGSVTTVLGANGAGKSSLASAIAGVVKPSAGRSRVRRSGHHGQGPARDRKLGLAYVPESRNIFPHLSVHDNLWAQIRFTLPRDQRKDAFEKAMEMFPVLSTRRTQAAGTLSGGEQQMLALARVLAASPKLLIADEMSLGLAPMIVDLVFESLERARDEGVTVLLIEQFVERALGFADQAVILRHGLVGWQGPASEAGDELLAEYLGGETASTL